ncbi:MAG: hypothetical protein ABI456_13740, partial [Ktedonobacteraceae bacterium]
MAHEPLHLLTASNGEPDYGQMIRFWRKHVLGWKNAGIVVDLYNEQARFVGEQEISVRWWQRMEHNNLVPTDQRRRRLIQVLLHIPPAYLAMTALAPFLSAEDAGTLFVALPHRSPDLDLHTLKPRLATFWRSRETKKPAVFAELISSTAALEQAVLYGTAPQRAHATLLLCQYLIAAGNACRYQGHMNIALAYIEKALTLAHERKPDDDQYALLFLKALYIRGFTHFNRWTNAGQDREADLVDAIADFDEAATLMHQASYAVPSAICAAILADGGRACSYRAQDRADTLAALKSIDQAGNQVSASTFSNDSQFLRVDTEWFHIDKAEALIAGGMH